MIDSSDRRMKQIPPEKQHSRWPLGNGSAGAREAAIVEPEGDKSGSVRRGRRGPSAPAEVCWWPRVYSGIICFIRLSLLLGKGRKAGIKKTEGKRLKVKNGNGGGGFTHLESRQIFRTIPVYFWNIYIYILHDL